MTDRDRSDDGSAQRRRERRVRSWLREGIPSVAADGLRTQKTVSSVGREVEAHETHAAARGQKEPPPPGMRPGSLAEPGPQRNAALLREYSSFSGAALAGGDSSRAPLSRSSCGKRMRRRRNRGKRRR